MIYARLNYPDHYSDQHDAIVSCLTNKFARIEHGHQGDSWVWVFSGDDKVAIDTFYAMQHEVKSESDDLAFIRTVIATLAKDFDVIVYEEPALEPHED